MKLSEYLEETGIPIAKFAKRVGTTKTTLYNLLAGRDVKGSILAKIQIVTKNKVSMMEIYKEFVEKNEPE